MGNFHTRCFIHGWTFWEDAPFFLAVPQLFAAWKHCTQNSQWELFCFFVCFLIIVAHWCESGFIYRISPRSHSVFFFLILAYDGRNGEGQLDFKQDKYAASRKIQPNKCCQIDDKRHLNYFPSISLLHKVINLSSFSVSSSEVSQVATTLPSVCFEVSLLRYLVSSRSLFLAVVVFFSWVSVGFFPSFIRKQVFQTRLTTLVMNKLRLLIF